MAANASFPASAPPRGARESARLAHVAPPANREAAFAAARRHSARVRGLRRAILVGAVGAVLALLAIAIFNPFGPRAPAIAFDSVGVDGSRVTMAKPRLSGFRGDGAPYAMTAAKATQDLKHPSLVELSGVEGEIGMGRGETMRMRADSGVYDTARERMELTSDVRIGNARYDVRLRSASIDFKTGVYRSAEPVEIRLGERATIFADSATAVNSGEEMIFEGHVRTRIAPQSDAASPPRAAKGAEP